MNVNLLCSSNHIITFRRNIKKFGHSRGCHKFLIEVSQWAVVDSGFPRRHGGANHRPWSKNLLFGKISAQKCMKMKEVGLRGEHQGRMSLDLPVMMVYQKIYLKAYANKKYSWHKNNTAQLYLIVWKADLTWNLSRIPQGCVNPISSVKNVLTDFPALIYTGF